MNDGQVTLTDFLAAFYPGADDPIRLRAFKPKGAPAGSQFYTVNLGIARARLVADSALQSELRAINETRGLYFVVNSGGDSDADITHVTSFFAEIDDLSIAQQIELFLAAPLLPSVLVTTRKSVHAYWLPSGDCSVEQWVEIQARLIAHFGSDKTIKNPSRVMRLPFFNHIHYDKRTDALERKPVELFLFEPDRRYTVEQLLGAFPAVAVEQRQQESAQHTAQFWSNFACDDSRAEARRRRYAERAIEVARNIIGEAPDGSRHEARRRASELLGGYVAGGFFSESEARGALEGAVRANTDSFGDAMKTIDSGLRHGQRKPITFEQKEREREQYLRQHPKPKKRKIEIHLEPVRRPTNTVTLEIPKRPVDTIQLPKPTRPAVTTEVAR